jgi:predicted AAA+ superfamily ATPase
MRHVPRALESRIRAATKAFPAVILTGPRRAGKTSLLKRVLKGGSYCLFEDPEVVGRFRADPRAFLDSLKLPALLDEVQHVPEIFAHVSARIDATPRRTGRWYLTGSQEAPLMRGVTESMAGRAAVLHLWPLSASETPKVSLLTGGYPEVLARPRTASLWFSSYVRTFLERDVRSITMVQDLSLFRRFLGVVASRHGQILNKSDIAAPLGMSVPSIGRWLDILEATGQVLIVQPWFENAGKRLLKAPRVYIADSGLACHLLGIESADELARSPFRGALFEGMIASEIVKAQENAGARREIYYFRDKSGLEVDFVLPAAGGRTRLVEAKASATVTPEMAVPLKRLGDALARRSPLRGEPELFIVHEHSRSGPATRAVSPGVRAFPWREFVTEILAARSTPTSARTRSRSGP